MFKRISKRKNGRQQRAVGWLPAVLTAVCLFLSGCNGFAGNAPEKTRTLKVSVQDTKGLRVTSQNPVSVEPGGTAEFTCELEDGATFIGIEGAEYRDGVIRMTNVRFPETLLPEIHRENNGSSDSDWMLIYEPNGGINVKTGDGESCSESFSREFYHCPNALNDDGSFVREGYSLLGYNTKADGSGTYYGPGWNVLVPEDGVIRLYCTWAKQSPETDFSCKIKGNEVTLTRYNGSDEFVVIPEKIDGKTVTGIAENTFRGNQNLKTVMLTKNLRRIENGAFSDLPRLTTLYFADTVTEMTDDFLVDAPAFSTLYVLAVRAPFYRDDRYGTYAVKFGRLITAESPKLVLVSGSNGTYGINSEVLETKLAAAGYPVNMVNYGQIAGNATAFNIEVISHFMNEGDFLLHMPEFASSHQFGDNSFSSPMWEMSESCYNVYSYVDIRHYTKVFSSFAEYNKARAAGKRECSYEEHSDLVNAYGDYSASKVGTEPETAAQLDGCDEAGGVGSHTLNSAVNLIKNADYRKELNRVFDMVAEKNAKVLFTFGSYARIALKKADQMPGVGGQKKYQDAVDKYLHCTRVSDFSSAMFERQYVFNSLQHLNNDGRVVRTDRMAEDLIRYFEGGGYGF